MCRKQVHEGRADVLLVPMCDYDQFGEPTMLALVQPPPVRTYLPLAIDVEMGSRTAVCVRKNQDTY